MRKDGAVVAMCLGSHSGFEWFRLAVEPVLQLNSSLPCSSAMLQAGSLLQETVLIHKNKNLALLA